MIWETYYRNGRPPTSNNKGSFWWKDIIKLLYKFKGFAKVELNDGKTCLLWSDIWVDTIPKLNFPELFSFAKNKTITVAEAKDTESLQNFFHLPLFEVAYPQFLQLQLLLQSVQQTEVRDRWGFIWGSNLFSSSRTYKHLSGHLQVHAAFKWLWRSLCQNKHKVFFWLILKNRLNTRGMLRRRNMELESFNCVLCSSQTKESIEHLFISCPFATQSWTSLNLHIDQSRSPLENLESFRAQIS